MNEQNGIYLGLSDPELVPVYVDITGPHMDLPPSYGIVGDPGTGKTFNPEDNAN